MRNATKTPITGKETIVVPKTDNSNNKKTKRTPVKNSFCNQEPHDEVLINRRHEYLNNLHVEEGKKIQSNRRKMHFFAELQAQFEKDVNKQGNRRLDLDEIMKASKDLLMSNSDHAAIEIKVKKGEVTYNNDEYNIAKSMTDQTIDNDIKQGRVSKYLLKLLANPKSISTWEKTRFENLLRAEAEMKNIRRKMIKGYREGKTVSKEDLQDEETKRRMQKVTTTESDGLGAIQSLNEDRILSDSEEDEILEEFTGIDPIR